MESNFSSMRFNVIFYVEVSDSFKLEFYGDECGSTFILLHVNV